MLFSLDGESNILKPMLFVKANKYLTEEVFNGTSLAPSSVSSKLLNHDHKLTGGGYYHSIIYIVIGEV